MKILIITYWKETNPGTFLQAFGVQYGLRKVFPNAEIKYLNYINAIKETELSCSTRGEAELIVDNLSFLQKVKHVIALYKRRLLFAEAQKKYMCVDDQKFNMYQDEDENKIFIEYENQYDLIVIGSDTIIESCQINGLWGIMWPSTKVKAPKVYFAASADSAVNLFNKPNLYEELRERVEDFSQIGLRDYVTIDFFKNKLKIPSKKLVKQPDPTFYLPLSIFSISEKKVKSIPIGSNKVVFYHFDRFFKYRKSLAKLLHDKGYYLITSEYDPNCDYSFCSLNPFEWAALFKYCDYVLTERFHDTVFAMRYQKPVITIDWKLRVMNSNMESKRLSVLKDFNCSDNHCIINTESDLHIVVDKLSKIGGNLYSKEVKLKVEEMIDIANNVALNLKEVIHK